MLRFLTPWRRVNLRLGSKRRPRRQPPAKQSRSRSPLRRRKQKKAKKLRLVKKRPATLKMMTQVAKREVRKFSKLVKTLTFRNLPD